MYKRIMIPLDGSKLAECVLPHVEAIAAGCDTREVILVSVTERIPVKQTRRDAVPDGYKMLDVSFYSSVPDPGVPSGDQMYVGAVGRMYKQAQRYLDRIARQLRQKGIEVRTEVLMGRPAEEIAGYGTKNEVDLIIMATHGNSGISRWVMGSTADRVLRSACVPVLMVRAPGCFPGI